MIIATPNEEIYKLIKSVNGISVKTNPNHETGTDRILEVFDKFCLKNETIINLQGDMPNIEPASIKMLMNYIKKNYCDIATLASEFKNDKEYSNENNVKVELKTF